MERILELNKDYKPNEHIKIPKGAKFQVLNETENGYKLKYLGLLVSHYNDEDIFYMHKHWFKEEFKLPKKWCIDMSNYKQGCVVAKFIKNDHWYLHSPDSVNFFHFTNNKFDYWNEYKNSKYIEITFNQFKKYVLKKESLPNQKLSILDIHTKLTKAGYDKEDINDILNILENE